MLSNKHYCFHSTAEVVEKTLKTVIFCGYEDVPKVAIEMSQPWSKTKNYSASSSLVTLIFGRNLLPEQKPFGLLMLLDKAQETKGFVAISPEILEAFRASEKPQSVLEMFKDLSGKNILAEGDDFELLGTFNSQGLPETEQSALKNFAEQARRTGLVHAGPENDNWLGEIDNRWHA